jgi:hypothetical protein
MSLVNRTQISLYEEAQAGLNSLVKQTAQVGVSFVGMLLLTGGNPPALTVGLSVVGGIAFVAWSEEKRLTKFYARQTHYNHDSVIEIEIEGAAIKIPLSQLSNPNKSESIESLRNHIKQQLIELDTDNSSEFMAKQRLLQARSSFNAARSAVVLSTCITIVGVGLLLSGKVAAAAVVTSSSILASISFFKLAKDGNDRLDRITK